MDDGMADRFYEGERWCKERDRGNIPGCEVKSADYFRFGRMFVRTCSGLTK